MCRPGDCAQLRCTIAGKHGVQDRAGAEERAAGEEEDGQKSEESGHGALGGEGTCAQDTAILPRMRGRICLVTGATSGIGRATAVELARRGATVVILARDLERGEQVRATIRQETGVSRDVLALVRLDLASLESVRRAAAEILERVPAVHVLVNNAGVHARARTLSADGLELTFAVNHLGHFLLTNLLLPRLIASAPARVVVVTSAFERLGRLDPDDLRLDRPLDPFRAYFRSKLANLLFTFELARRLQGTRVTANAVHPGLVATGLLREFPRIIRSTYEWALRSPASGAIGPVRLASAPELRDITGRYFGPDGRERAGSERARDVALAAQLWRESERLTGLE